MKTFNTTGVCVPQRHYMVDLTSRLVAIKAMVDAGDYFTINRGRQYGKTTTLTALAGFLSGDYEVLSLDFQGVSSAGFASESAFVQAFCRLIKREKWSGLKLPKEIERMLDACMDKSGVVLDELFEIITKWCDRAPRKLVLIIDEVDSATNNQVFLDFLAQLREGYIRREAKGVPAFQSVILAGVTDVKHLRRKLRQEDEHRFNSPWNIAAEFKVDMSFSAEDIAGMLEQYEADHRTGMDIPAVAHEIEAYTSGYPFLVSRVCQLMDGDPVLGWDRCGVGEAVRRLLFERNTLFESLMGKVQGSEALQRALKTILFSGEGVSFNAYDVGMADAEMYGFVNSEGGKVRIANRIFETLLYNYFLSQAEGDAPTYSAGSEAHDSFIVNGRLNMERVLERYVTVHDDLFGDRDETLSEAEGRLRFLLFVRPIINGTGNYYIEAETRNHRRMDLVIDYQGERFVVELKLWRGESYHERGERQLKEYLDYYHLKKGYMLSYCFNKDKHIGVKHISLGDVELVEAVV